MHCTCSSLKYNRTIFPSSERPLLTMTTERVVIEPAVDYLAAASPQVDQLKLCGSLQILKFWLPDTRVEDESLQVVLLLENLQNLWFASKSYMSHGKSFSHVHTNFHFDEDWDVLLPESSLPLLRSRVEVLVVWFDPCSDNSAAFDDRNALISITRVIIWSYICAKICHLNFNFII